MVSRGAVLLSGSPDDVIRQTIDALEDAHENGIIEKHCNGRQAAAVFDVDECLLWNLDGDVVQAREDMRSLWLYCKDKNYKLVIVTARPKSVKGEAYLKRQLKELQYGEVTNGIDRIYMMPRTEDDVGVYKNKQRRRILERHEWVPVVMAGDQWTDVYAHGKSPFGGHEEQYENDHDRAHLLARPDDVTLFGLKLNDRRL